jgi:hypothetical protein
MASSVPIFFFLSQIFIHLYGPLSLTCFSYFSTTAGHLNTRYFEPHAILGLPSNSANHHQPTTTKSAKMQFSLFFSILLAGAPILAAPIGPDGPCPDVSTHLSLDYRTHQILTSLFLQAKVDAILKGEMDPSECCSYGVCKGDVVVSVG